MSTEAGPAKEQKGLGFFERYLTVWVILCILAGIVFEMEDGQTSVKNMQEIIDAIINASLSRLEKQSIGIHPGKVLVPYNKRPLHDDLCVGDIHCSRVHKRADRRDCQAFW